MILTELSDYLSQEQKVSRRKLAKQFGMSEDGVDAMMAIWMKKGKVSRTRDKSESNVTYNWIVKPEQIALNVVTG
ncbi:iron transporter FeoC [Vibrio sp. SCSIO 43132]|uniref:FeoC-like transcriptional regulator n=1 Tax=Vibrio sp. SCSIO 43132 TaxID=2779363 RepID=UPI001CA8C104|nr:FeoC-like transcriptional regulator [Vibrio sp. SCSIO 43132]UAB69501.1 iron transporter FeoC [Vibrio sp. SCSIO 43132]